MLFFLAVSPTARPALAAAVPFVGIRARKEEASRDGSTERRRWPPAYSERPRFDPKFWLGEWAYWQLELTIFTPVA